MCGSIPPGRYDPSGSIDSLHRFVNERSGRADGNDAAILDTDVHGDSLGGHNDGSAGD